MSNSSPTSYVSWKKLQDHRNKIDTDRIENLFGTGQKRHNKFIKKFDAITFDYSKTKITEETISLLSDLANEAELSGWQNQMMSGAAINNTDNRAALHMALRGSADKTLEIDGKNINTQVDESLAHIRNFSEKIRQEKRFTHIVNIGVGGSDIGPYLVCNALKDYANENVATYFLSSVDPAQAYQLFSHLDAKKTLFIVASKSFGTQETKANFELACKWIKHEMEDADWQDHFVAITARKDRAIENGFDTTQIFDMPPWVGGRFSLWSAIGLTIPILVGFDNFRALLDGAHAADQHFLNTPWADNIPALMGLIGIWHRNFCGYKSLCVLPYNYALRSIPSYVQQLDMESNGKMVDRDGNTIDYDTSPVVFGGLGTNAQHAFFQMLHQGTDVVPCEFIVSKTTQAGTSSEYDLLLSNVLGQTKAFVLGQNNQELPYKHFNGDRPSTTLWLDSITPYNLGILMAFYEHKTFTQGAIWNLNSFDQWGVELGKILAKEALDEM